MNDSVQRWAILPVVNPAGGLALAATKAANGEYVTYADHLSGIAATFEDAAKAVDALTTRCSREGHSEEAWCRDCRIGQECVDRAIAAIRALGAARLDLPNGEGER